MNLKEGEYLVKLARKSLFSDIKLEGKFKEERGVFVTLYSFPEKELRGCIGFIEPEFELEKGIVEAARAAAFNDPRFAPLGEDEEVIVEVSILTEPKLLEKPYEENIEIGKDGLIVEYEDNKGLLLPIVAVEWKWKANEFLKQTCKKAGVSTKVLDEENCRVYKFQTEVFSEESPNGKIIKKM